MPDNYQNDNREGSNPPLENKKSKKKTAAKIIVSVVVVAAVAVTAYFLLRPEETGDGNSLLVGDYDDIENMKKQAEEGYITVAMDMDWIIPDPKEPFPVRVMNSNDNHRNFFIEVTLNSSDEVVYTSDVVPVGKEIREIQLDKTDLAPGEHTATCAYNILNDEGEVYDYAYFEITLQVG